MKKKKKTVNIFYTIKYTKNINISDEQAKNPNLCSKTGFCARIKVIILLYVSQTIILKEAPTIQK